MALRDYTLSNMMIWGAGAVLLVGATGAGAAMWLGDRQPVVVAMAPPVALAALPSVPAAPMAKPPTELPKLRLAIAKPRPALRLPAPPRLVAQPAHVHPRPAPMPPSYSPPQPQWQRAYSVAPYPMPYYAYQPRYREYSPYPGY